MKLTVPLASRASRYALSHLLAGLAISTMALQAAGAATDVEKLAAFSLEQLAEAEVTSVSKSAEMLRDAPSSIYVITQDEIRRSGVTTIPDALRLAPNLHISQYTSNRYIAGARGFAGAEEAQNFSNKLLILIRWTQHLLAPVLRCLPGCAGCGTRRHQAHRSHQRTWRDTLGRECDERRNQHHHQTSLSHRRHLSSDGSGHE
jgi:hypothetical protein